MDVSVDSNPVSSKRASFDRACVWTGCVAGRAVTTGVALLGAAVILACTGATPSDRGGAPLGVGSSQPTRDAPVRGRIETSSYFFDAAERDIEYAYYLPSSYRPGRAAPLVVVLHGLFSNPGQVIRYAGLVDEAERRGYVLVAPFGYNDRGWYGSMGPGRANIGRRGGDPGPENLGELSEQDVWNVLELAGKRFDVDPARTFLMGHSMGGGGTLHLAMRRPEVFAAVAALAPAIYGDPSRVEAMRDVPAIVVQGSDDRLVPVQGTRRWVDEMKSLGMTHRYIEIADGDHVASIARNPGMISEVFDFFDAHPRTDR